MHSLLDRYWNITFHALDDIPEFTITEKANDFIEACVIPAKPGLWTRIKKVEEWKPSQFIDLTRG